MCIQKSVLAPDSTAAATCEARPALACNTVHRCSRAGSEPHVLTTEVSTVEQHNTPSGRQARAQTQYSPHLAAEAAARCGDAEGAAHGFLGAHGACHNARVCALGTRTRLRQAHACVSVVLSTQQARCQLFRGSSRAPADINASELVTRATRKKRKCKIAQHSGHAPSCGTGGRWAGHRRQRGGLEEWSRRNSRRVSECANRGRATNLTTANLGVS
jgi:hypothetical protein